MQRIFLFLALSTSLYSFGIVHTLPYDFFHHQSTLYSLEQIFALAHPLIQTSKKTKERGDILLKKKLMHMPHQEIESLSFSTIEKIIKNPKLVQYFISNSELDINKEFIFSRGHRSLFHLGPKETHGNLVCTLLSLAIEMEKKESIQLLVNDEKIDVNKSNVTTIIEREYQIKKITFTPLTLSIYKHNTGAHQLLLAKQEINPNKYATEKGGIFNRRTHTTPLYFAAVSRNYTAIVDLLRHPKIKIPKQLKHRIEMCIEQRKTKEVAQLILKDEVAFNSVYLSALA